MRLRTRSVGAVLGVVALLGCAPPPHSGPGAFAVTSKSSPLARVKGGMTFSQVVEILGPPNAQRSQLTPHAFNPLAIGNQGQVTYFHYAKVGRVVFAGPDFRGQNAAVIAVEEDSGETGL